MQKLIEAINGTVKLASSLISLAVLLGLVGGGYWAYTKVTDWFRNPPQIVIPTPEISLFGKKEPTPPPPPKPPTRGEMYGEPDDPPGLIDTRCNHVTK